MSDFPKVGDKVRVVLEGLVVSGSQSGDRFTMGDDPGRNVIFPDAEHVKSIEILPEPLKVGDMVVVAERDGGLPYNAVVINEESGNTLRKTELGWMVDTEAYVAGTTLVTPRRIVWLP